MIFHKNRFAVLFSPLLMLTFLVSTSFTALSDEHLTYPIVDTNQIHCFSADSVIACGQSFNGQDAQYDGLQPAYQDNGDGTVTDLNTGLMWQQDPVAKMSYAEAVAGADSFNLAGYDDWRLPSNKELYSLIDFTGIDGSAASSTEDLIPYIDDDYFAFQYGDTSNNERLIDSQWATTNVYVSKVMNNQECFFGVNLADGRIKCYPTQTRQGGYFTIYVRGDAYGINNFADNGDGTVTDHATGLTWMHADNGMGVTWGDALSYCEGLSLAGADDWRLPNIKELHSILDYSRSPDTTNSPALDPIFNATVITNEAGQPDYAFYWSSTTHIGYPSKLSEAAYISFGRGMGNMSEFGGWIDVHGAGAQRSDNKVSIPVGEEEGHGPQGDARRSSNYVRCIQGGTAQPSNGADPSTLTLSTDSLAPPLQQGNGQSNTSQPPAQNNQSGGQQQPPPEAFTACNGLAQNATCSVQTPNGTLNGTCQSIQDQLACVPNR
jgi:hypothetical protein